MIPSKHADSQFVDDKSTLNPEKTPLFIGADVVVSGSIAYSGNTSDRAVILGELKGDLNWNGIVQVAQGGTISVGKKIACRELVVAGVIRGEGVVVETGLLRLEPTANVQVDEVFLPSGGLEQSRGSIFNGRLVMTPDHPYADVLNTPAPAQSTPAPTAAPAVSAVAAAAAAVTSTMAAIKAAPAQTASQATGRPAPASTAQTVAAAPTPATKPTPVADTLTSNVSGLPASATFSPNFKAETPIVADEEKFASSKF